MSAAQDLPVVEIEHLYAGYEDETVLEDINLTVYPRDFVGIIGPNGGGKTTLLKNHVRADSHPQRQGSHSGTFRSGRTRPHRLCAPVGKF